MSKTPLRRTATAAVLTCTNGTREGVDYPPSCAFKVVAGKPLRLTSLSVHACKDPPTSLFPTTLRARGAVLGWLC